MTTYGWITIDTSELDSSWMDFAACTGITSDLMFAEGKGNLVDAKAICATCVVKDECLDWAMAVPERFGCWGGTSPRERENMRRRQRLALRVSVGAA